MVMRDAAFAILTSINTNRKPEEFIFHGWKAGTGLSNGAMLALMGKMKFGQYTPHGFRSCFRDWAAEEAHGFQNETVEQPDCAGWFRTQQRCKGYSLP